MKYTLQKNAYEEIEIMLKQTDKLINKLDNKSRQCLYEKYNKWIENLEERVKEQDAIIFYI